MGRWLRFTPRKSHCNRLAIRSHHQRSKTTTYEASQNREGGNHGTNKSQGDDNGGVGGVIVEGVVNLRQLSVSRGLGGWDGDVDVALDGELENGVVIGLRAAKSTNNHAGVNGVGESEELEGEFLLSLFV